MATVQGVHQEPGQKQPSTREVRGGEGRLGSLGLSCSGSVLVILPPLPFLLFPDSLVCVCTHVHGEGPQLRSCWNFWSKKQPLLSFLRLCPGSSSLRLLSRLRKPREPPGGATAGRGRHAATPTLRQQRLREERTAAPHPAVRGCVMPPSQCWGGPPGKGRWLGKGLLAGWLVRALFQAFSLR